MKTRSLRAVSLLGFHARPVDLWKPADKNERESKGKQKEKKKKRKTNIKYKEVEPEDRRKYFPTRRQDTRGTKKSDLMTINVALSQLLSWNFLVNLKIIRNKVSNQFGDPGTQHKSLFSRSTYTFFLLHALAGLIRPKVP